MAYSLLAHAIAASSGNPTTSAINTTGADLIVLSVASLNTTTTVSDNKGNTWTPLTLRGGSGGTRSQQLFYCHAPTVGSGHTFSTSGGGFAALGVQAWGGSAAVPFDQESGAAGATQPGSITPAEANELLVAGFTTSDAGTESVDGGFTVSDQVPNSTSVALMMTYLVETTVAAKNPAASPGSNGRCAMAAFKAAAAGGSVGAPYYYRHLAGGGGI